MCPSLLSYAVSVTHSRRQGQSLPAGQTMRLNPVDKRLPFVYLPRHSLPPDVVKEPHLCTGKVFVVDIESWEEHGRFPQGACHLIASQHTLNQRRLQQCTTPTVYVSSKHVLPSLVRVTQSRLVD